MSSAILIVTPVVMGGGLPLLKGFERPGDFGAIRIVG